jgi:flagellar motor switch protein FliM
MFGGRGKIGNRARTDRDREIGYFTVARRLYRAGQSWEHLVNIEIEQKSFETNPQFIQIVPPGNLVVISLVKLFQSTGLLTICYPHVSLEPVVTVVRAN